MDNSIKVIIRFRNLTEDEQVSNWEIEEEQIVYHNGKQDEIFGFDTIMPPITLQEEVFNEIMLPKINFFMQGYNSAVFAYGATSSGKTYTILGPETTITQLVQNSDTIPIDNDSGILPRSFVEIIDGYKSIRQQEAVKEATLKVSYVEIYNEAVYDLLNQKFRTNKDQRVDLKIGNVSEGPKLVGVREVVVAEVGDLLQQVALGTKNRSVGVTQFNSRSSRSHVIFSVELVVEWHDKSIRTSKIQFVDLAGSERLAKSVAKGQVLEETKKINQSLTCLGHCIMALSSGKKKHVPYRDSKLTLLLKECLGGNSNTSFICAVSGAVEHEEKTLQTLRFAQRAKKIVNKVRLNIKLSYDQMEKQMGLLKQELSMMERVLLVHGIKYDKQLFQDDLTKYTAVSLTEQQPAMSIEQLTQEYRKSIRKTINKQQRQNLKDEFRTKFQLYMDQQANSMSGSSKQGRTTTSLPQSLDGSELDEGELSNESRHDHQLIEAIEAIMKSPKELDFIGVRLTRQQSTQCDEIQHHTVVKKRDTCCQIW